MEHDEFAQRIQEALAGDDADELRQLLADIHPADIAYAANELDLPELWRILTTLSTEDRAETFGYLSPERQIALAHTLDRRQLAHFFRHMSADERADLYNQLDPEQQEAILPSLAQAERDDIRKLSSYEEDTAGAIMTSEYSTLVPGLTASEAIQRLRQEAPDKETIYQSYVVDSERRLLGTVSLRDLIVARSRTPVSELMTTDVISGYVNDDKEDVAARISKYDLIALPIVDEYERMVGIVTYDDAMDVAEEEATEDFQRVGTVSSLESSVREASIRMLYQARIFWLVILIFANAFSGAGIAFFEETIEAHVALVFFLPLLIASSGNAGSQAATLTVRAMATGDIQVRDWGRMLGRELLVALLLGLTMALAVSVLGILRGGAEIAMVVALTMIAIVVIGSLLGLSLPFVLRIFDLDPATASTPLVTSLADVAGVVIYFSLATWLLALPTAG